MYPRCSKCRTFSPNFKLNRNSSVRDERDSRGPRLLLPAAMSTATTSATDGIAWLRPASFLGAVASASRAETSAGAGADTPRGSVPKAATAAAAAAARRAGGCGRAWPMSQLPGNAKAACGFPDNRAWSLRRRPPLATPAVVRGEPGEQVPEEEAPNEDGDEGGCRAPSSPAARSAWPHDMPSPLANSPVQGGCIPTSQAKGCCSGCSSAARPDIARDIARSNATAAMFEMTLT
mmetsp:Transcript_35082/g.111709  ORF Transcript_35082/g.111709 Transcript_35082/m.111709 type:complete len:234 (-) Transcript_35082:10-711(-)